MCQFMCHSSRHQENGHINIDIGFISKRDKEEEQRGNLAGVFEGAVGGASRDYRPRLLPRKVGGRSRGTRRHPGEHCQDTHVLCAKAPIGAAQSGGCG